MQAKRVRPDTTDTPPLDSPKRRCHAHPASWPDAGARDAGWMDVDGGSGEGHVASRRGAVDFGSACGLDDRAGTCPVDAAASAPSSAAASRGGSPRRAPPSLPLPLPPPPAPLAETRRRRPPNLNLHLTLEPFIEGALCTPVCSATRTPGLPPPWPLPPLPSASHLTHVPPNTATSTSSTAPAPQPLLPSLSALSLSDSDDAAPTPASIDSAFEAALWDSASALLASEPSAAMARRRRAMSVPVPHAPWPLSPTDTDRSHAEA